MMKKSILFITYFLLLHFCSFATNYTSAGTGSWTSPSSWSPVGVPSSGDNVTILSGNNVTTVPDPDKVLNLTINSGGTLTLGGSGGSLWVAGVLTNNGIITGSGNIAFLRAGGIVITGAGTWNGHTGFLTFANNTSTSQIIDANVVIIKATGSIFMNNLSANNSNEWVTNNGSITLSNGTITEGTNSNPAKWTQGAGSSFSISSALPTVATFTLEASAANNTVTYTGNTTYNINQPAGNQFSNLTIAAGIKRISYNLIVNNLTANIGASLGRTIVVDVTISGNWQADGTLMGGAGGTVTFNGSSPQTIGGAASTQQFPSLTIASTSTVTLARNVQVNNDLSVSSGTYNLGAFTSNRGSAGGTITVSNGATLQIGGTNTFPANYSTNTLGTSSTVEYNGSGAQIVAPKTYGNLTIDNASGVSSSGAVSIKGATTALTSGTYSVNSTLTFNGASAQTISGSGSINCSTAGTITMNNSAGVTTSSSMNIDGTITVSAGTFATGASTITLTSAADHTGRIGNSAGSITGTDWRAQRFIPASTANWDDFSTPINGNNLSDWDNELYMSIASNCPDGMAGGSHSVFYFIPATQTFDSVQVCNYPLSSAEGFELWLATTSNSLSQTTIDSRGTPNIGSKAASLANGAGNWALIGNPYASSIDWALVYAGASGLSNFFQVYDETINDYALYDPSGGSTGQLASSGGIISATQGFWVQNSGASPSLTFQESYKSATNTPFVREASDLPNNILKMRLYSLNRKNACESVVKINEDGNENFNPSTDVSFMRSPDTITPNLTPVTSDGIKTRSYTVPEKSSLSIPLKVQVYVPGDYFIDFKGINTIFGYNCISLEDQETGTTTPLTSDKTFSFSQYDISKERTFILHLANKCNAQTDFANTVRVYSVPEGVTLNFNFEELTNADISVYNLLGENIASQNVRTEKGITTIPLPGASQIYFVRVTTSAGTSTYKIFH